MKRLKLLLALSTMLALIACLFSVPALSGENPWDADGGNGGGVGSPMDTVLNDAGTINTSPVITTPTDPTDPEDSYPGWINQALVKVSTFYINTYMKWYSLTSGFSQRNKFEY